MLQINIIGFKDPNWQEVDQLAIYKGVELGSAEKQFQLGDPSENLTSDPQNFKSGAFSTPRAASPILCQCLE